MLNFCSEGAHALQVAIFKASSHLPVCGYYPLGTIQLLVFRLATVQKLPNQLGQGLKGHQSKN